jgi:hypothetical protein
MKISAFVLVPIDKKSLERFEVAIQPACESLDITCSRVSGLDDTHQKISGADIIIADTTDVDPSILLTTGYASALGKRILVITNNDSTLIDTKRYLGIIHSNDLEVLKESLTTHLKLYKEDILVRNFKADTGIDKTDAAIETVFAKTNVHSNQDLVNRLELAKSHFTSFGLTRNFYVSDVLFDLIKRKALQISIKIFLMDPGCDSRKDRYRLEPSDAALEDIKKYKETIESKYLELMSEVNNHPSKAVNAGINVYRFNFPCSFAIEEIDDHCRVMLYGHNKRGTDSPIFVFKSDNPCYEYFISQLRWMEEMAASPEVAEPWKRKRIEITSI